MLEEWRGLRYRDGGLTIREVFHDGQSSHLDRSGGRGHNRRGWMPQPTKKHFVRYGARYWLSTNSLTYLEWRPHDESAAGKTFKGSLRASLYPTLDFVKNGAPGSSV